MNVTHLNCGTMREIPADGREPARVVCHCLVIEAEHGLVLVETGFGAVDVTQPSVALGDAFLERTAPVLSPSETAAAQLIARGYAPSDVTDIVLTHLDLDHSGGLPDFPGARVHLHDAEYRAAMAVSDAHPEHTLRYPARALGSSAALGDLSVTAGRVVVRVRRRAAGRTAIGVVAGAPRRALRRALRGGGPNR
ncbi:MBL fold metallo-hydrolase [Actinophytocola algeriensis]|uniref:Glyoxylase-like metal-dependent hydrolase (Beta-lactamase superfamily II) n=1 Tax=Actinophytocola algeriensis TaxID=1768010 RepID=A0A7W7VC98_9PSEU|nr:MBL fold metallo-hydrolase [Actinophytocola algeriensis]MBB4904831.1 glyoxylase-like metal-dependent hydrolase (beta-lactamase superfamily II) [Actinophytocola algeriensis]MBE1476310.1 glyoxylase-like metal-dependent hydrolase (beta-lactamase superfamily II) [Actinophytocola algeriensis]